MPNPSSQRVSLLLPSLLALLIDFVIVQSVETKSFYLYSNRLAVRPSPPPHRKENRSPNYVLFSSFLMNHTLPFLEFHGPVPPDPKELPKAFSFTK